MSMDETADTQPDTADELPDYQELVDRTEQLQRTQEMMQRKLNARTDLLYRAIFGGDTDNVPDPTELEAIVDDIADEGGILELAESIPDLETRLDEEQRTRSKNDGRIERRITALTKELDQDVDLDAHMEDDKLARLLMHGPADVTNRVTKTYERARWLLTNIENGDIVNVAEDYHGQLVTYRSSEVRSHLREHEDSAIESKQVQRVFDKIEDLAADSDRRVKVGVAQRPDGRGKVRKLQIWNPEDLARYARKLRDDS